MSKTGYSRVYGKFGSYYYVDLKRKWHRLSRVSAGEPAMLRALARIKGQPEAAAPGSMLALISAWREKELPRYAESTRANYTLMLAHIEGAMRDLMVAGVTSHDVMDLRDQWLDKPRSANAYQALLSVLMSFAILKRMRTDNPCRDVKKLEEKTRKRLMSDEEQLKIVEGAVVGRRHSGTGKPWKNANGAMYGALFEFTYLTALRAKDVRLLRWSDVGEAEFIVEPTKTKGSSAAKIAVEVTPAIKAVLERARGLGKVKSTFVFHTLRGKPFSASAVKAAWRRARERAGVSGPWFRDLRPKALSDARRRGLSMEQLRDAAAHASVATTEGYMRGFEVRDAKLGLTLPKKKTSNS